MQDFAINLAVIFHNDRQNKLYDVLIEIGNIYEKKKLFEYVVDKIPGLVFGRGCSVFLRQQRDDNIVKLSLAYTSSPELKRNKDPKGEVIDLQYKIGHGKTGFVADMKRSLLINYYGSGKIRNRMIKEDFKKYSKDANNLVCYLRDENGQNVGITRIFRRENEMLFSEEEKNAFYAFREKTIYKRSGLASYRQVTCETGRSGFAQSFLAVPIKLKANNEDLLGVIRIPRTPEGGRFSDMDLELVESIAGRLATVLEIQENLRDKLDILNDINLKINSPFDKDKIIDEILKAVTEKIGFEFAAIQLVDKSGENIETLRGWKNSTIKDAIDPNEWKGASHPLNPPDGKRDIHAYVLMELKDSIVIKGWDDHFDKKIYDWFKHKDLIRAFVPIIVGEPNTGEQIGIGTLEAGHNIGRKDSIDDQELYMLKAVANQVAITLENRKLLQNIERAKSVVHENLQILSDINAKINSPSDKDDIIDEILKAVTENLGYEFATIELVNTEGDTIETVRGRKNPNIEDAVDPAHWIGLSHPLNPPAGEMRDIHAYVLMELKDSIVIKGWDDHFDKKIYDKFNYKGLIRAFVPIIAYEPETGELIRIGTLEAGHNIRRKNLIAEEELEMLKAVVNQVAIAIENHKLIQKSKIDAAKTFHSIKGKTSAILGGIASLKKTLRKGHSPELIIGDLSSSARALNEITNKLVDISTPKSLSKEKVNFRELVNEVIAELSLGEIIIKKKVARKLPIVFVDKKYMKEALKEILDNTIQVLKEDGREHAIWIKILQVNQNHIRKLSSRFHSGGIMIQIKDDGSGIPIDYKKRIWELGFFLRHGGSGLGLFEVAQVVDNHKGICYEDGTEGKGARFNIILPALNDINERLP